MKKIIFSIALLIAGVCVYSCSSENEPINEEQKSIEARAIGTDAYINSLKQIEVKSTETRTIEDEEKRISQLIQVSIDYLEANGISYTEFCEDKNDPRIAVIAMGLAEYEKTYDMPTTRAGLGGCVLEAVGVKDLGKAGAKAAAKQIGKAVLKRAVPYIGWGLFAADLVYCLAN